MALIHRDDAEERIKALMDRDDILYAAIRAGVDGDVEYWLAIHWREYESNEYLDERYILLSETDDIDDTFMQNGINRRQNDDTAKLADKLESAYNHVQQIEELFERGTLDPQEFAEDGQPGLYDAT